MTFKEWFDDMQERYQAYYGGYEELLQEAFEAGAKQEREECAKVCYELPWKDMTQIPSNLAFAAAIRARGQA